jgi:hypothetical protein
METSVFNRLSSRSSYQRSRARRIWFRINRTSRSLLDFTHHRGVGERDSFIVGDAVVFRPDSIGE